MNKIEISWQNHTVDCPVSIPMVEVLSVLRFASRDSICFPLIASKCALSVSEATPSLALKGSPVAEARRPMMRALRCLCMSAKDHSSLLSYRINTGTPKSSLISSRSSEIERLVVNYFLRKVCAYLSLVASFDHSPVCDFSKFRSHFRRNIVSLRWSLMEPRFSLVVI